MSQMCRPGGVHLADYSSIRLRQKSSDLEPVIVLQQLVGADLSLAIGADVVKPSTFV